MLPLLITTMFHTLSTLPNHYKFDSYDTGVYGHVNEHFLSANKMGHTLLGMSILDELFVHVLTHYLTVQLFALFL